MAERVLGRTLSLENEVHHVNKVKHENKTNNLVICEDRAYHFLLHKRQRAVEAGFPATWMKCAFCKHYDAPGNLILCKSGPQRQWHRACRITYRSYGGDYAKI